MIQPYALAGRAECEADLDELAGAGRAPTEPMVESETQRQFDADQEIVRALDRTLIHYIGRLALPSCRPLVLRLALARIVPAPGQLAVGYSQRVGLGLLDSSQTMRLEFSTGLGGDSDGSRTACSWSDSKTKRTSRPEVSAPCRQSCRKVGCIGCYTSAGPRAV